jgi:hypothetical protein
VALPKTVQEVAVRLGAQLQSIDDSQREDNKRAPLTQAQLLYAEQRRTGCYQEAVKNLLSVLVEKEKEEARVQQVRAQARARRTAHPG